MTAPGLYIHIPFCERKCNYCNFFSISRLKDIPRYLKALLDEISLYKENYSFFDSIYIGGGTPSVLSAADLDEILGQVRRFYIIPADTEITVEVNPADVNLNYVEALRQMGVNRLNIGAQSFDDHVLAFLGRRHRSDQAIDAYALARSAGFNNVGLDMIYGIPGQNRFSWINTLSTAISLHPEHLSCYQLTLEAVTPLGKRCRNGEFVMPDEDASADLFFMTSEFLTDAGYIHYEVSNFAREEAFMSRHNRKYWSGTPYLGLGPSAHSFKNNLRWWNHRSVRQYLRDLHSGRPPIAERETLTPDQQRLEACMLGLRTKRGIPLSFLSGVNGRIDLNGRHALLERLAGDGLVVIENGFLKPTRRGLAVADGLALSIAP